MSTSQTNPVPTPVVPEPPSVSQQFRNAQKTVTYYSRWAAGLGLIPMPLVDWAAVTGMQLGMLHSLCKEYGVPFDKRRAARYISALTAGFVPATAGYSLASLTKMIPIVGIASFVVVPVVAYASTWALGQVFVPFFESGGNFYTFDPDSHQAGFAEFYLKGKAAAETTNS